MWNILAGVRIFYKEDETIYAQTVGGISVPGFFSLKASVNPVTVSQAKYHQQVNSLFGRIGFSWNSTIYIEATGRNDWSSTLPEDTRSYFYPSVAASFVISELLPESTRSWLDLLKVRSSWTMSKTPAGIYAINSAFYDQQRYMGYAERSNCSFQFYTEKASSLKAPIHLR